MEIKIQEGRCNFCTHHSPETSLPLLKEHQHFRKGEKGENAEGRVAIEKRKKRRKDGKLKGLLGLLR